MTIIKKEYLSDEDYIDIKNLENLCCSYDNVNLKLEVDYKYNSHTDKKSGKINEFLCYENDMLAAYIGLCNFSGNTYEINGMTHPDMRRRGLFKALFHDAIRECNDSGKILLLSDNKSESGIAFIEAIGGRYEFCEYRMSMSNNKPAVDDEHTIRLRKAEKSDMKEIWKQDNIYFNDTDKNDIDEDDDSYELTYIIEKENVSVGKIRVEYTDDKAFICGFGILPDFRGKGYGKSAFHKMLQLIYNNGITNVELDVDSNNMTALNLYKSFGFKEISVMNYYHYLP